jgi:hypothetical protein
MSEQSVEPPVATVTYYDAVNDIEQVALNGHEFQFGGTGSGYCYTHQSFDCLDQITTAEQEALDRV